MPRSLKVQDDWIERTRLALKRNGFHTQRSLAEQAGYSLATVKKFLAGKPVDTATFFEFCHSLNLNWQAIAECDSRASPPPSDPSQSGAPLTSTKSNQEWGEAVDVSVFYGRHAELETLKGWIVTDRCRLIAILGMGGIGKTTLTAKFAHLIQDEFDYLIWHSLRNAPPIQDVLTQLLHFFAERPEIDVPRTDRSECLDTQLHQLIGMFRNHRCLIILDNAESLFQAGERVGTYRGGYEFYGQLFQTIGETDHNSCLLLTSRERPREFAVIAGDRLPVRCFQLSGLLNIDSRDLIQTRGEFTGSDAEWARLIQTYGGNPLALKMIAASVRDYFDSSLSSFLKLHQQTPLQFDDIHSLLDRQLERLTPLERDIVDWLAIHREPVAWQALQTSFASKVAPDSVMQAIDSLDQRSLLEKHRRWITLQPVVMEYLIWKAIERVCREIDGGEIRLLRSHALIQAGAKDYIRHTQIRLILQPIIERLRSTYGSDAEIAERLRDILDRVRSQSAKHSGYIGGNILNLLRHLQVNLQGYDLSNLTIWQANLQGIDLQDVSFAGSDLSNSRFNQPFGSIRTLAFSPSGEHLATGDTNSEIWIRQTDLASGDIGPHLMTLRGHSNWVCSVAFSPDGEYLASGSADRTIRIWQVSTGECLQTLEGHSNWVMSVAFSPDGEYLASGSADRSIKIWQLNGGECLRTLEGHSHGVWSIAFSPQGDWLVSGSADRTIKVWDWNTGPCCQTLAGHRLGVWTVAVSPQGDYLASGSADRTIKLWDTRTGCCYRTMAGHTNWVWSLVFSPQGDRLASASADRTIRLWQIDSGRCLQVMQGHSNWVWSVAYSPQADYLVSGSEDRSMKLWSIDKGQCLKTLQGCSNWVWALSFSPQEDLLASGNGDRLVHLWDVNSGTCVDTLSGAEKAIWSVAFSPDGDVLASGNEDGKVRLWNVRSRRQMKRLSGHTQTIWSVAFNPTNEQQLATGSADRTIKLWDVPTGQCRQTLARHDHWVCSVAFHPDGDLLASGSYDRTLKLWDLATGTCLRTLSGHTSGLWKIAFSPQGKLLASSSTDCTARLWDAITGQCLQVLQGHRNWVMSVAISPDGRYVASGSADRTIKLWDATGGKCLHTFSGHGNTVWSVAFSPDGKYLASGSDDKTIKMWVVKTGDCVRTLKTRDPYEGMDITGIVGLTEAEIATLKELGAVEH